MANGGHEEGRGNACSEVPYEKDCWCAKGVSLRTSERGQIFLPGAFRGDSTEKYEEKNWRENDPA